MESNTLITQRKKNIKKKIKRLFKCSGHEYTEASVAGKIGFRTEIPDFPGQFQPSRLRCQHGCCVSEQMLLTGCLNSTGIASSLQRLRRRQAACDIDILKVQTHRILFIGSSLLKYNASPSLGICAWKTGS